MTRKFSDYLASRPTVTDAIGATDTLLVFQNGSLKRINAQLTAVLTDIDGSGERCQVTARYDGLDDNGEKIWSVVPKPL